MTASKLLHVLGGGPWQIPTVRLAKALGLRVLVTDMYSDRPAYALADAHEVVDITHTEATLDVARRHRIDGILCDTTDFGVPTAAYVAERMGLPGIGFETALNCTNKTRMRRCVEQAGLCVPRHVTIRAHADLPAAIECVGIPLVAKPVDNQAGRGVSIVARRQDVTAAFTQAKRFSRSGMVLLESTVAGTEIIADGFVVDGRCHVLGVARKVPYPDNRTIASRIIYESTWSLICTREQVHAGCAATVDALGLRNGVFHAEFIVGPDQVVPIDFAARGGGVMIYTHAIPHIAGADVNRAMIEMAVGRPVAIRARPRPLAANIEFIRSHPGVLDAVLGIESALRVPGVAAIHLNLERGQRIGSLTQKDDRLGYVVALGDTTEQVLAAARDAEALLSVRIAGTNAALPVQ